jgi:hypothetical protein
MGASTPVAAKANGLSTVLDTIVAPAEAFERLRSAPTWGWAVIAAIVLLVIGTYLQAPAARHAATSQVQKMMSTSTLFANATAEQKQRAMENAGKTSALSYVGPIVVLFVAALLNTLILLIGNAAGRGQADFKRLWCASMNIAVPTIGLGAVILGVITIIRGANSFESALSIAQAVPSLSMLVPHGGIVLGAFLAAISIFTVWGFFLNATMLRVTAKTSAGVAYTFATIVLVLGALFPAALAAFGRKFGMF